MRRPLVLLALMLGWTMPTRPVWALERAELEVLLARPIIGPELALEEVQVFTESRVPTMPRVETRAQWEQEAERIRQQVLEQVVFRGKAAGWRDAQTKVEWLGEIPSGSGYQLKRLRYEALPGLWIPALLYEPEQLEGKVPVVLNVNGHDGNGKAAPYKQIRCINLARRGMLALNVEWLGMGQLRGDGYAHYRMNQLDLCGTSGLAPFYLAMSRGLDLLLSLEHADPQRVAVAGLSGGGWQTILISSLDKRVMLSNPVAGYSSFRTRARFFSDLGDSEQTPTDLAVWADYLHLTALRAPRPTLLTYNAKDDCCFQADHALPPLIRAAAPIYRLYGKEPVLRAHVNTDPGTHNFERDNREALYRMISDHFYGSQLDATEIECQDEVKTADELQVELPAGNADFHSLAASLLAELPLEAALPTDKSAAESWQSARRPQLEELVRASRWQVEAHEHGREDRDGLRVVFWRLRVGGSWTVPAVEIAPESAAEAVVLVADEGRKSLAEEVEAILAQGKRAIAVDPFYFGESQIKERDFLFGLLVSAVGQRPLGIQASQLAAISRWAAGSSGDGVTLRARGPRSSLFTLVAAALEPEAIAGVELAGSMGSLKEVVEQNKGVNETPELFCFGLLERFDIKQLTALVAPRPVTFRDPSDRLGAELAELAEWYGLLGESFDPVAGGQ